MINSIRKKIINVYKKKSYSQTGEDLIVKYIFDSIGISKPSFIDVGAHHPYYLNNTALFYENGCRGINIEPDISLIRPFYKIRRKDINLNIGIGESDNNLDFYIMNVPTLNTFSKEEADKYQNEGNYYIKEIRKVPVKNFREIIKRYNNNVYPDFLTIDAEGIDETIVKSIDYSFNPPTVICLETISFSEKGHGIKNQNIISFLESKGYLVYADTYINTIFVLKKKWVRN